MNDAGKSADIHYGSGAISGFFSQDNVKVGDLVVKKQVLVSAFCFLNIMSNRLYNDAFSTTTI